MAGSASIPPEKSRSLGLAASSPASLIGTFGVMAPIPLILPLRAGSYPFYPLLRLIAAHQIDALTALVVIGLVGGLVNGSYAYVLADRFPAPVRLSGQLGRVAQQG